MADTDDLTDSGRLRALQLWFHNVLQSGPPFGYDAVPSKSWLVVKESLHDEDFQRHVHGYHQKREKHLSAAIGKMDFCQLFIDSLVKDLVAEIKALSSVTSFEPQSA